MRTKLNFTFFPSICDSKLKVARNHSTSNNGVIKFPAFGVYYDKQQNIQEVDEDRKNNRGTMEKKVEWKIPANVSIVINRRLKLELNKADRIVERLWRSRASKQGTNLLSLFSESLNSDCSWKREEQWHQTCSVASSDGMTPFNSNSAIRD